MESPCIFQVLVNGKPIQATESSGLRSGNFRLDLWNGWVVARGDNGIGIGCSLSQDVCAVKLNGYYHGKVMGLLGKYNQESFDDFSSPDGQVFMLSTNLN